jgi:hypothetical protein
MDIVTFVYIACAWSLFHWVCYFLLAKKLVRSDRFKKYSVPTMALYAGGGSFVTTLMIHVGLMWSHEIVSRIGGPIPLLAMFGTVYVSSRIWLDKFTYRGRAYFYFVVPPSASIAWPVVGPVFALIWLALSFGLEELVGAGKAADERDREKDIGYLIASVAAILLVIYISSVVLGEVYGISMYDYFFK